MKCNKSTTNQSMRKYTVSLTAASEMMLTGNFNDTKKIYSGRSLIR